ncbi:MAG: hypothetical protein ABDH21_01865 [bacterium]
MIKKGFSLYLWLSIFTLFVATFSIALFNYVSGDIRVSKDLIKETKQYNIIKSVAAIATELYRTQGQTQGTFVFEGRSFRFSVSSKSASTIVVSISQNNRDLAKVIVRYRKANSDINLYVARSNNRDRYTIRFHEPVGQIIYPTFATTANHLELDIPGGSKILRSAMISERTSVNGKAAREVTDSNGKSYIEYENLQELQKYSHRVSLIPENTTNILLSSCNLLASLLAQRSRQSKTFFEENVDLTRYGSIYISYPHLNARIKMRFDTENSNQIIRINVEYTRRGNVEEDKYEYYLIREPQTINVTTDRNSFRTNQDDLYQQISNGRLELQPSSPYVYKVLLKYRDNSSNQVERSIVYRTSDIRTYIYSEESIQIQDNDKMSIINNSILLVTKADLNIHDNIVYQEFVPIENHLTEFANEQVNFPSDSDSYLCAVANNINIYTLMNHVLCGEYIAFYDSNSGIDLINLAGQTMVYYFGSNLAYNRYEPYTLGAKDKILVDSRQGSNLIKMYFNTFDILGIQTFR